MIPKSWGASMADENGMKCELQLPRPDGWKVKLQSDAIYEKWRNVINVFSLSNAEYAFYMKDIEKSKQMWNQLSLPDFSIWSSSFAERTRALNMSSDETGTEGLVQTPSRNSLTLTRGSEDSSSMRPSSVMQATAAPPNIPSGNRTARPEGKGKISAVRSNTLENG